MYMQVSCGHLLHPVQTLGATDIFRFAGRKMHIESCCPFITLCVVYFFVQRSASCFAFWYRILYLSSSLIRENRTLPIP